MCLVCERGRQRIFENRGSLVKANMVPVEVRGGFCRVPFELHRESIGSYPAPPSDCRMIKLLSGGSRAEGVCDRGSEPAG